MSARLEDGECDGTLPDSDARSIGAERRLSASDLRRAYILDQRKAREPPPPTCERCRERVATEGDLLCEQCWNRRSVPLNYAELMRRKRF